MIDTVEIRNGSSATPDATIPDPDSPMGSAVEAVEIQMIQEALMTSDHVKVRAAEKLGISERNLRYKMKKYGIPDRKQRGSK